MTEQERHPNSTQSNLPAQNVTLRYELAARSDTGKVRTENEDFFTSREVQGALIAALADGMGGLAEGGLASRSVATDALDLMEAALRTSQPLSEGEFWTYLYRELQLGLERQLKSFDYEVKAGTTLLLLCLRDQEAFLTHCGDSRAYLFRQGTLSQLTRDHNLPEEWVDEGRLKPEEVAHHPRRNILTRHLGSEGVARPDYFPLQLEVGDQLLLCSDGLYNEVAPPRIVSCLEAGTMQESLDALMAAALEGAAGDNVTALLVRIERQKEFIL